MNPFSQLPAVKKDSKNGAAKIFFDPSYFNLALGMYESVSYNNLLLRAAKHVFEGIHLLTTCLVHLSLGSCGIIHNGVKPFGESY